jgi:hypothetical protein
VHVPGLLLRAVPPRRPFRLLGADAGDRTDRERGHDPHGQSWLPGFGDFTCRAVVSQCNFNACYWSSKDAGRFTMTRF